MVVTLGQQYNVGEKPPVILLYTYINHHAGTNKNNVVHKTNKKDTNNIPRVLSTCRGKERRILIGPW